MYMVLVLLLAAWSASVAALALTAIADGEYLDGMVCGLLSAGFLTATWMVT